MHKRRVAWANVPAYGLANGLQKDGNPKLCILPDVMSWNPDEVASTTTPAGTIVNLSRTASLTIRK